MAVPNIMHYKGFPIDLDGISRDMVNDSLKELKELFFLEGCYAPLIRWSSAVQSDWPRPHRALFSFWKDNGRFPFNPQVLVSQESLHAIKDSLLIVQCHEDHNDFSYAWIGYTLKSAGFIFKENKSILKTAEHENSATALFQFTCLRACALRIKPLLTMYQQEISSGVQIWSTMTVPFTDEKGKLTGFACSVVFSK